MPGVIKFFDSYKLYHFAGRKPVEGKMALVWVPCFDNGKQVGALTFTKTDAALAENSYQDDQISLFYGLDRFDEIVTTLRYESPLFLMLNTDSLEGALITQELEPVGEEESSGKQRNSFRVSR